MHNLDYKFRRFPTFFTGDSKLNNIILNTFLDIRAFYNDHVKKTYVSIANERMFDFYWNGEKKNRKNKMFENRKSIVITFESSTHSCLLLWMFQTHYYQYNNTNSYCKVSIIFNTSKNLTIDFIGHFSRIQSFFVECFRYVLLKIYFHNTFYRLLVVSENFIFLIDSLKNY